MSWFGHTFLVVVQDVFFDVEELPTDVSAVAAACGKVDKAVGRYIATHYSEDTLPELFAAAGIVPEA
jgi:hypothetical protein